MRRILLILTTLTTFNVYAATENSALPAENNTMATTPPTVTQQPSPLKATLSLKQEGQRLYARVIINQAENTHGKIRIDWVPPTHSSCDKSTYFLSYQGKQFHTQAYRTLGYGLINGKSVTCTGTWQANVIDAQGKMIASDSVTIESVDAYANNTAAKMHSLAVIA